MNKGIEFYVFYEPDFGPLGYTALCTEPLDDNDPRRKYFRKWNLFKHTT